MSALPPVACRSVDDQSRRTRRSLAGVTAFLLLGLLIAHGVFAWQLNRTIARLEASLEQADVSPAQITIFGEAFYETGLAARNLGGTLFAFAGVAVMMVMVTSMRKRSARERHDDVAEQ